MPKPNSLLLLIGVVSISSLSLAAPKASKPAVKDDVARILVDGITGNARASRDEARELRSQSEALAAKGNYKAAMDKRVKMLAIRSGDISFFGVMTAIVIQEMALSDLGTVAFHLDAPACRYYAQQMKQLEARKPTYAAFIRRDKGNQIRRLALVSGTPQAWQKFITGFGFSPSDEKKLRKTPLAQVKSNIERFYNLKLSHALKPYPNKPYSNNKQSVPVDPYTSYAIQYSIPTRIIWAKYDMKMRFAIAALEDRADHLQKQTRKAPLLADPFGTGPLKEKNGVIYSIGPDTKDNGGQSVPKPNRIEATSKGDIIAPSFLKAQDCGCGVG